MKKTVTNVQAYLTQIEKKNDCLNRLNVLKQQINTSAIEYEKCVFEYFGLLMDDISKHRSLSKVEREFVANNLHLLDKYPMAQRQSIKNRLIKEGYIKPEPQKPVLKTVKVTKTYSELFPDTDMKYTIEQSVKKLKDAYVYLKPGIKLCDKLIDYIKSLKFTVSTTVEAPKADKKPTGKDIPMTM